MKKTILAMILAVSGCLAYADDDVKLSAQEKKDVSYMLGYAMGEQWHLSKMPMAVELDKQQVLLGLQDSLDNKSARLSEDEQMRLSEAVIHKMSLYSDKQAQENLEKGKQFLAQNKMQAGVQTTASGLQYRVNKAGSGARVKLGDTVSVKYIGKLIDGKVFDGEPEYYVLRGFTLQDGMVSSGWFEGLQLMQKGGEYTLFIPADLAYDEASQNPTIPLNSVLIFDIKVIDIEAASVKKGTDSRQRKRR
ncbi:FKBP-type peptidyl-prolyl cis-trans isomerase [Wielerella bovis]|uniref:FKBP-type peptidyl-prolyl cis-trans isomerase n=1 Tax=Wielerella bovis TaxID=2917790 RepID=UPI002019428B|nr:FKBP-type peptidyl-prolyl cis-trans isomerase [Wielerella bovis]MCG7657685.1 FKBP-type peptidyl-prolyl cis-trans isomerase [Wielerella bovis]MCG7659906.1 FKBP-type peptidyl-prolyl cis-trans isomerase [Wielerella bovis]